MDGNIADLVAFAVLCHAQVAGTSTKSLRSGEVRIRGLVLQLRRPKQVNLHAHCKPILANGAKFYFMT